MPIGTAETCFSSCCKATETPCVACTEGAAKTDSCLRNAKIGASRIAISDLTPFRLAGCESPDRREEAVCILFALGAG